MIASAADPQYESSFRMLMSRDRDWPNHPLNQQRLMAKFYRSDGPRAFAGGKGGF